MDVARRATNDNDQFARNASFRPLSVIICDILPHPRCQMDQAWACTLHHAAAESPALCVFIDLRVAIVQRRQQM